MYFNVILLGAQHAGCVNLGEMVSGFPSVEDVEMKILRNSEKSKWSEF